MSRAEVMVKIAADAKGYTSAMATASRSTHAFSTRVAKEFNSVKNTLTSVKGQMMGIGVGFGVAKAVSDATQFEKQMRLLEISTGASRTEMEAWRNDLVKNQRATGASRDAQLEFSKSLQAGGFGMEAIRAGTEAASATFAIAETDATALGHAVSIAVEQFKIDKNDAGAIKELLDKMMVGGIAGNAELQDLPDILADVATAAKDAGMNIDQTIAYIETLSKTQANPGKLATLVDSSLRVFTNAKYMHQAQKATGVHFFDDKGARRDPVKIIQDMRDGMKSMTNDAQRFSYISKAFQTMDTETIKGLKTMVETGKIEEFARILNTIQNSKGFTAGALNTGLDNAIAQASRLGAVLRDSIEVGIRPLDHLIARGISFVLDPRQPESGVGQDEDPRDVRARKTGLGASGLEIGLGAGAGLTALWGAAKLGKGAINLGANKILGLGAGVATGKALQATAGVTPVYVVNFPDSNFKKPDAPTTPKLPDFPGSPSTNTTAEKKKRSRSQKTPIEPVSEAIEEALETNVKTGVFQTVKSGVKRFSKKAGGAAALAGTAIEVGEVMFDDEASHGEKAHAATTAAGSAAGGWAGAEAGALAGALAGPIGAVLGALIGGGLGAWGGGMIGDKAGARVERFVDGVPSTPQAQASSVDMSVLAQNKVLLGSMQTLVQTMSPAMNTSSNSTDFIAKYMAAGSTVTQQNAQALTGVTSQAAAQQQAVGAALISQVGNTQIKGTIMVNVAPSSSLLNVTATAVGGNSNTTMTANVGRLNTGAS